MQQTSTIPKRGTLGLSRPWWIIVALLATLGINFLAEALPLAGRTTGEISDLFPVLVTPAGYVFSIWSLIYLSLVMYAVFQALPAGRENPLARRIAPWFIASSIFNSLWIIVWHYLGIGLSVLLMLGLLLSLIAIYQTLSSASNPREYWLLKLPFSLYLGWISLASITNVAVWLYQLNWNGWGIPAGVWAALMLAVPTLIGLTLLRQRRDVVFVLVLVWALVGIAVKQWPNLGVAFFSVLMALLLVGALLQRFSPKGQMFARVKNPL